MSFTITKNTYTFAPGDDIVLDYKSTEPVNYGYLYGVGEDTLNSKSYSDAQLTFPPFNKEGTYSGCYVGTYVGADWTQSNNVTIIIKKKEVTPPPDPETKPFKTLKNSYKFKNNENVVIDVNQKCNGGYLYGVPNAPLNATNETPKVKTFPIIKATGTYSNCYLGSYINGKWVQSNNFQLTIEDANVEPPPTPDPPPEPTESAKENLRNSKDDFNAKYNSLVAAYKALLGKDSISDTDKNNISILSDSFKLSLANVNTCLEKATENINSNKIAGVTEVLENKISTVKSSLEVKDNEINSKVQEVEKTTQTLNGTVVNNTSRIQTAEQKLMPGSIINSVSGALSGGDVINGTTTTLTKDSFTVSSSAGSKIVLSNGTVNAYNSSNKRTYYLDNNAIGICAKDNSDPLGIISSVYKVSGSYNDKGNSVCWTDPSGRTFKGIGYLGGDYAGFITMGIDNSWGVDTGYDEFFRGHKGGWLHMGTDINFSYEHGIANISNINRNEVAETYFNKIQIKRNSINTNSTSDKNLWLNFGCGAESLENQVNGTSTYIGNGFESGTTGRLFCGDFHAYGQKNRIVDCGDLGFIAMSAYETATPSFGDFGSAKTDADGNCIIILEREQMEVSNTNINYNVQVTVVSNDLNAKVQVVDKKPHMVKFIGTPNTSFDYEFKFIQRGYEDYRFKRIDEKRSLKTNFSVNEEVQGKTSREYNRIHKDDTIMKDIELNRGFNLAKIKEVTNNTNTDIVLSLIDDLNFTKERRNRNGNI